MNESLNDKSINETLNVIRNALQDENNNNNNKEILLLDKLVKEDGTIKKINSNNITQSEIKQLLDEKLSEVFDLHFEKWLNNNIPNYLEKYFSKKEK
tara:strand:+ start:178 stop:468 length:291 start_codon:yes stop_codon:yes gene_type:complete